jgi:hypothetical protein
MLAFVDPPHADHSGFGFRHFGRQHAGAHGAGQPRGPCSKHHAADDPDRQPGIAPDDGPVAGPALLAYINALINKQALFIAYLDDFKLMMIVSFAVLPLRLFMKRGSKADDTPMVHVD